MNVNGSNQTRFVRILVLNALINCKKIAVVGKPDDYHKIYFFTDAHRYYKVELKWPGCFVPKRFNDGGKTVLNRGMKNPMWNLVDKATAHAMLRDCPYKSTSEDRLVEKPNSEVMDWVRFILTSKPMVCEVSQ